MSSLPTATYASEEAALIAQASVNKADGAVRERLPKKLPRY
jgi:hypothetical protein